MRIWVASDLHTEYKQNFEWVAGLSTTEYQQDALIIAGDVAHKNDIVDITLQLCVERFAAVFYCPGNHDLWHGSAHPDSMTRYEELKQICQRLGVHTRPRKLACEKEHGRGVWVVPILSWYHQSFDTEPDLVLPAGARLAKPIVPVEKGCSDFLFCKWPASMDPEGKDPGGDELARYFDEMNEPMLSDLETVLEMDEHQDDVITFSHYLPRQELLPEKRMLFYPSLPKAAGSAYVEKRLRALGAKAHVFGHTHFLWDMELEGVRYVQWALGSPQEQKRRNPFGETNDLFLLYDSEAGGFTARKPYYWPEWYRRNRRDPTSPAMAPYTAHIYCPDAPKVPLPQAFTD